MVDSQKLCPSSIATEKSKLIGFKQKDGTIGMLNRPIEIDLKFLENCASKNIVPESEFRFAGICEKSNCKQWSDNKCLIANKTLLIANTLLLKDKLSNCSIRANCQWYAQEQYNACRVCKFIARL